MSLLLYTLFVVLTCAVPIRLSPAFRALESKSEKTPCWVHVDGVVSSAYANGNSTVFAGPGLAETACLTTPHCQAVVYSPGVGYTMRASGPPGLTNSATGVFTLFRCDNFSSPCPFGSTIQCWVAVSSVVSSGGIGNNTVFASPAAAQQACFASSSCKAVTCQPSGCTMRTTGPPGTANNASGVYTLFRCEGAMTSLPAPTAAPTRTPTRTPTSAPTLTPTRTPTSAPTLTPTQTPTPFPTQAPTRLYKLAGSNASNADCVSIGSTTVSNLQDCQRNCDLVGQCNTINYHASVCSFRDCNGWPTTQVDAGYVVYTMNFRTYRQVGSADSVVESCPIVGGVISPNPQACQSACDNSYPCDTVNFVSDSNYCSFRQCTTYPQSTSTSSGTMAYTALGDPAQAWRTYYEIAGGSLDIAAQCPVITSVFGLGGEACRARCDVTVSCTTVNIYARLGDPTPSCYLLACTSEMKVGYYQGSVVYSTFPSRGYYQVGGANIGNVACPNATDAQTAATLLLCKQFCDANAQCTAFNYIEATQVCQLLACLAWPVVVYSAGSQLWTTYSTATSPTVVDDPSQPPPGCFTYYPGKFISGAVNPLNYDTLYQAEGACLSLLDMCSGVVREPTGYYKLRAAKIPHYSSSGEDAYVKC